MMQFPDSREVLLESSQTSSQSLIRSSLGVFGLIVAFVIICVAATLILPQWRPSQVPATRSWISICTSYFGVLCGATVVLEPAAGAWFTGWLGCIMFALSLALNVVLHAVCGSKLANITSYGGRTYPYFIKHRLGSSFALLYGVWGIYMTFAIISSELNSVAHIAQSIDSSLDVNRAVWILNTSMCIFCAALLTYWPIVFRCNLVLFVASLLSGSISISVAIKQFIDTLPPSALQLAFALNRGQQSITYYCFLFLKEFVTHLLHPFLWTLLYSAKDAPAWQTGAFSGGCSSLLISFLASLTGLIVWGASQSHAYLNPNDFPAFGIMMDSRVRSVLLSSVFCLSLLCVLCAAAGCLVITESLFTRYGHKKYLAHFTLYLVLASSLLIRYYCPEDVTLRLNLLSVYGSALLVPAFLLSMWPLVSTEGCAWGVCAGVLTVCCFGWTYGHSFADGFKWWFRRTCIEETISLTSEDCTAPWVTISTATAVTTIWTMAYSQWQFKLHPHVYEAQVRRLMVLQAITPLSPLQKSDPQTSSQRASANEKAWIARSEEFIDSESSRQSLSDKEVPYSTRTTSYEEHSDVAPYHGVYSIQCES